MEKWFFTFGVGQVHKGKYVEIHADDMNTARKRMFDMHGPAWSMMYSEEQFKGLPELYNWSRLGDIKS